jgi:hypothetical protein
MKISCIYVTIKIMVINFWKWIWLMAPLYVFELIKGFKQYYSSGNGVVGVRGDK